MKPFIALSLILAVGASAISQAQTPSFAFNQPIQSITDSAVDTATKKLNPHRVVVIVAEPSTGKILAITGRRTGSNVATDDAVSWIYEPGSAFVPVAAIAALQEGKITPTTKINCEHGVFKVGSDTIRDQHGAGDLTFEEILTRSSNIGAAKLALMLTDPVYYEYVRRFGFGELTGISIPGEDKGVVYPVSRWDSHTKSQMAYGQSVAVTPIQLAMAYCALANGGLLMKPVGSYEQPVVVRRVCSTQTADTVKNALHGTVTDEGTAPLAHIDGVSVAGKTATSLAMTPHFKYYPDKYTTSFAGFFPVEKPKYVIVVLVDQADVKHEKNYGGLVAAPIFADIAGKISKLN